MLEFIITEGVPFVIFVFILILHGYYKIKLSIDESIISALSHGITFASMWTAPEYYPLIDAIIVIGIIFLLVLIFEGLYYILKMKIPISIKSIWYEKTTWIPVILYVFLEYLFDLM
ncbi:MAG: hypothetical protein PQ964_05255 [Methanobacteriaceae archaeon]